jgi:hypothetical protein
MKRKTRPPLTPLETGQIWQMGDSNVHIGLVGKHLVHYKLFKGQTKRAPISLAGIGVVEKYLKDSKAILIQHPPPSALPPARMSAR